MMMYSRFMIVLTLVSMIGLALPSDPQRKIAKGSKKNPPLMFRQDVPVSVVVPEAMSMQKLEDTVTETVLDILEELQKTDNDRRKLAVFRHTRMSVQTTDTAPTECSEKYEGVVCFAATVSIASNEDLGDVISKLRDLLGKVIHGRNGAVVTTSNNKTGSPLPYVKITNKTPYEADYVSLIILLGSVLTMYIMLLPDRHGLHHRVVLVWLEKLRPALRCRQMAII